MVPCFLDPIIIHWFLVFSLRGPHIETLLHPTKKFAVKIKEIY
jgi:hypothetical protein